MNLLKRPVTMMALSGLVLTALTSDAKVSVNATFTDNMILQRDRDIPIWGKADPGETVTVEYASQQGTGQASRKVTTQAGEDGKWQIADTDSIRDFSALLFSFGHALQKELDVPVGLMCCAVNGTPSGRWLTEAMASASPSFVKMFKEGSGFKSFEELNADRAKRKADYKIEVQKAKAEGKKPPRFVEGAVSIGDLYKGRIQPLVELQLGESLQQGRPAGIDDHNLTKV